MALTLRETAINEALNRLQTCFPEDRERILSDLIDQAEAGKLREPLPIWHTGANGHLIIHPDGKREHRP